MTQLAIAPQELQIIETAKGDVIAQANTLTIVDRPTWDAANELLRTIKRFAKQVEDTFGPSAKAAHEAHKAILAARDKHLKQFTAAEQTVKGKILAWQRVEAMRIEEERRAAEQKARDEAEARQTAEAEALIEQGRNQEALATLQAPVVVPTIVAPMQPKAEGVSVVKRWTFRVVNESMIPREYLIVDEGKIRGVVRALGSEARIPGVEVFQAEELRART